MAVLIAAPFFWANVANADAPAVIPPSPLVIPRPKQIEARAPEDAFRLNRKTRLVVRDDATDADRRGPLLLQTELQTRFGLTVPIVAAREAKNNKNAIVFGEPDDKTVLGRSLVGLPPLKPEGYTVLTTPDTTFVAGYDPQGTLWGAETVIQLLDADAQGPRIRPIVVHDWPSLGLRAVHLFYGQNALPFQEKLIDRVLARFKMNALFIQSEQLRWDADPQVAPAWAGHKEQIRDEIVFAKSRGMTIYPLVEAYGHMEWLFHRDSNRDFAEDPQTPYAVDFTNPAAIAYMDKFVGEASDLFGAPAFHVGLDEVTMRGRLPLRSAPHTFPELFLIAADHWHDFLAARGETMWMWADMALSHEDVTPGWGSATTADAAAIRAGLPKDIVMVDWQYGDLPSYPSLQRLKDAGFTKIVAATWLDGEGIRKFTKAATDVGAIGAIQTTWAGYESNESVLQTEERKQFVAMVLAADYFWNGGDGPAVSALPYDPAVVFAQQWGDSHPAPPANSK